jgi:hypothetical protein
LTAIIKPMPSGTPAVCYMPSLPYFAADGVNSLERFAGN